MKENTEISIVWLKFAAVVASTYLPRSSALSEKPMAWTRKSSRPHSCASVAKTASMEAASVTSQGSTISDPTEAASGATRLPSASPW